MFFYTFLPKLLNMSLTASVVIVLVLLLRLLLKKAPKVISYALWSIVLFRLLCPISLASGLSLFGLLDTPTVPGGTLTSRIEYIPSDIVHMEDPSVVLPAPGIGEAVSSTLSQGEEQLAADPLEAPMAIGTYIWMAGVLGMGIYAAISCLRLRGKLVTASLLRENIYLADEIPSPFVMGLLRPRIYLPSSLGEREQPYIVAHEQHHIRRLDHIVKMLAFIALSIHWFNPLVWLAFVTAGRDMEMSCDEAVVKKMGDGVLADYTASLLSLATGRRIIAGTPLAFGEGDAKGRIRNLANWRRPAFWAVLMGAAICIAAAVCLLTNPAAPVDAKLAVFLDCQIAQHHQSDRSGENYCCLDWEVLGTQREGDLVTVYLWVLYLEYSDAATVETGAHIPTVITAREQEGNYTPVEYWEPRDGSDYAEDIRAKFPPHLQSKALDAQQFIEEQTAKLEAQAQAHFAQAEPNAAGLVPGTTYVSYQCIYMNPLSSYAAVGGDSGCTYTAAENAFEIVQRKSGARNVIEVQSWTWQPFPYSDVEWAALILPESSTISDLSDRYDEVLYLPLTADKFLMRVDGDIWIAELSSNEQMGTYLWSIYSLIPEPAMGAAQWEYAPAQSSKIPVFQFRFDLEYTEISAGCAAGQLVEFNFGHQAAASSLTFPAGAPLSWSPMNNEDTIAGETAIHFTVYDGGSTPYHGTIYIGSFDDPDRGCTIYTASLVGTGLHLAQASEHSGGIISLLH